MNTLDQLIDEVLHLEYALAHGDAPLDLIEAIANTAPKLAKALKVANERLIDMARRHVNIESGLFYDEPYKEQYDDMRRTASEGLQEIEKILEGEWPPNN